MLSTITRRLTALGAALVLVAAAAVPCRATPLNLVPAGSFTADILTSFTSANYNSTTDVLSLAGVPLAIDYNQCAPPDAQITSGGIGNPVSYAINVIINSAGSLVGPGTATDLNIIGRIASGPHP